MVFTLLVLCRIILVGYFLDPERLSLVASDQRTCLF